MKAKICVLFASIMVQSSAFAAVDTLLCQTPVTAGTRIAAQARISLNYPAGMSGSYALLKFSTESSTRRMNCVIPAVARPFGPDVPYPIAFCNDGARDSGFSIDVEGGGYAGIVRATVFEKNYVKNRPVASMVCRSVNHI